MAMVNNILKWFLISLENFIFLILFFTNYTLIKQFIN